MKKTAKTMSKKLELENFQSHKESVLEFEPGVNVIIGSSDSGKTSLIRAIRWIAWNRPLGDDFVSNWSDTATARLEFEDGLVERFKGPTDHYYCNTYEDGDEIEFKAFGTSVPEEIQEFLNFDEINIQEQMDSPFLISDNPGQVSRHFNKVANIDQIDTSLRNVESWVRSIRQDIQAAEEEKKRYEEKLQEFDYLDKMETDVEVLERLEESKNSTANKASRLSNIIEGIEQLAEEIEEESELLSAEELVDQLLTLTEEKNGLIDRHRTIKNHCKKIIQTNKELKQTKRLTSAENKVDNVLNLYNKKEELDTQHNQLDALIEDIENKKIKVENAKDKLDDLETTWHEAAPETCPLCGSAMES